MLSEGLADNAGVVLGAYVAIGIPLHVYLYHDVIDKRWRTFDQLRNYSIRYGVLAGFAFVMLFLYAILQIVADDYKEGGAAALSCVVALYGLYLYRRQVVILRFFQDHLQRRADDIISVYDNENTWASDDGTRECTLLFPRASYKKGPVNGHLSAVFLDDNYPGEGPRVTWLRRTPMVKDWTEMMVRTGLWVRLAVIPSTLSFDTALRPSAIRSGVPDTSGAWTLAVVQQQFLTSGDRKSVQKKPEGLLETFIKCVKGEQGTLSTWRETLSLAPESEWSQALSEFPSDWIEGLQAGGIGWEVYLAMALHTADTMGSSKPPSRCWPRCIKIPRCMLAFCCCWGGTATASISQQRHKTGIAENPSELQQKVEKLVIATVGEDGFVTPAALMAGFPQEDECTWNWLASVEQLSGAWHRVAQSLTPDENPLDEKLTAGVDLVVALAILLGANKSSFDFSGCRGQEMKGTLKERHKHVVLNKLQVEEAEKVLTVSLERLLESKVPDSDTARLRYSLDIAQSRYSLGKLLHDRVRPCCSFC